jgi:hypothetical protein
VEDTATLLDHYIFAHRSLQGWKWGEAGHGCMSAISPAGPICILRVHAPARHAAGAAAIAEGPEAGYLGENVCPSSRSGETGHNLGRPRMTRPFVH